jgi:hypothetical protein
VNDREIHHRALRRAVWGTRRATETAPSTPIANDRADASQRSGDHDDTERR